MNTAKGSNHETHRKTAIIVGVLFIIATAFLFNGKAIYDPFLSAPNYLEIAYPNRTIVTIGMLLEFACVIAIPLIPVFLFPVLRKHYETLALGYVVLRLFEAVLFILVEINKLSLIGVSQAYLNRGSLDASYFQNLGGAIQAWNDWAFSFYVIVFTVGGLLFYSALYGSRLVPRWISAWGFIAAGLLFIGMLRIMVDLFAGISDLGLELVLAPPIAVNEMVLAVWLIVKGFNALAIAQEELPPKPQLSAKVG
jgi:hypothetical protein